ncbi:hypothetical protein FJR05_06965 [Dolichospermum sp. UHCC 0259]|nr:hypothetical protein [Dolichospermum sp. UHCC 0259]
MLGSKIFNALAQGRNLRCLYCDKIQPHTPRSYGEIPSSSQYATYDRMIIGRILDYVPGVMPLTGGNIYICNICELPRFEGGLMSDIINDRIEKEFIQLLKDHAEDEENSDFLEKNPLIRRRIGK